MTPLPFATVRRLLLVQSLCAAFLVTPTHAQNLLTNSEFDVSIDGWSIGSQRFISPDWDFLDRDDNNDSGSMHIFGAAVGAVAQCVEVEGGVAHDFGGSVYEFSTSGNADYALRLLWFDTFDCAGDFIAEDVIHDDVHPG